MPEEEYPEHKKLKAISSQSQIIGEFLDWLNAQEGDDRVMLAQYLYITLDWRGRECRLREPVLVPASTSIQDLLAKYFEIDLEKIEMEKRAMLESMRRANSPA